MINPMIPSHMIAAGTRVIHSRSCVLGSVVINTAAASSTLTLYNNTAGSGDIVAIIDCATAGPRYLQYNISCPNGLTAVMAAGNADVTITSEGPQT